ncbi:hypothetical protein BBJ41_23435 [Burkholderia stabilis]|nr:hypothetical protein BBJ41_23435 [Burkholderia stabilis]
MVRVDRQRRAALRRIDGHALVGDGLDRRFEAFALRGRRGRGAAPSIPAAAPAAASGTTHDSVRTAGSTREGRIRSKTTEMSDMVANLF